MHLQFIKRIAEHHARARAFLTAGFILFVIVAPPFFSAYQYDQLQTNQLQDPTSDIDLNEMMLSSWKNWDALLTRWLSLNGTLVDSYDYILRSWGAPSNISLSGISFYSLALINMYEQTGDNYYLSKLRTLIEGLIDNQFCYVDVYSVGNIFYVPAFYVQKSEHDYDPTPTMLTAFASLKLWNWTQNAKFKQLADRVARESVLLAVVNNSTDLAWSRYYCWGRDENNAKKWVSRQSPITLFYVLYGKEINQTYLEYVNRTLHWQFRAQLSSGGLAASIGETIEDNASTGLQMFLLIWGYRISAVQYVGYETNMTNAVGWLQSLPIDFAYMENYAVTGALTNSWKANFTQVDIKKIRTAIYLGLKTLDFTTSGVFPKSGIDPKSGIAYVAYGWRWPQSFIACFLSNYPLPSGAFQPSEITQLISHSAAVQDQDLVYKWKTNLGFDRLRINSPYGSGLYQWRGTSPQGGTLYFLFGWKKDPPFDTPVSIIDNFDHYLNVKSIYTFSTIDQQIYASGLATAHISGTITFSVLQRTQSKIDITLANGTTLILNDFANQTLNLGNTFIVRQNENPTQFFFIKSSSSTWTTYNETSLLQLKTTFSDGDKLLLARLQVTNISASDALDLFDYYATYFDQTSPITFTHMVESYVQLKNHVGEREYGLPQWRTSYENATQKDVKLVALSLPENVNVSYWDFAERHLTANFSGVLGVNSNLKIYSGYKFSPIQVFINDINQTQFQGVVWSFDAATRTFTVNVSFSSSSLKLDVFFTEDKTPPSILKVERSIESPEYNDTVTVSANITDDDSGVGTVLLEYWNGTYWLNVTMTLNLNNSLYEGQIPPLPFLTDVNYKVHAADRAENWISSEMHYYLVIDTYPPVVTILVRHLYPNGSWILRPADGDYMSGNATIVVYCQEANLEVMQLYIDDALVELWDSNRTQFYKWDTTVLVDGSSHILKLTANDLAGNPSDVTATVFPDNTRPLIGSPNWNPKTPAPGESVTVTVSVTDATSGVESVYLWHRNGTAQFFNQSMTLKDGVWNAIIPGHQDGTNIEFFIEAYDNAGNQAQTQSTYKYYVGYSPIPIYLLIITAGICIGIISAGAFLYYRKHRKIKTEKLTTEQQIPKN